MSIHTNPVQEYGHTHSLLPGQVFMEAYRKLMGRHLTLVEQKQVCQDLAAYQVHGTIPPYVRQLTEGG